MPAEDFHADEAFLHLTGVAGEGLLDDEAEQCGITLTLRKKRVGEEQFELG